MTRAADLSVAVEATDTTWSARIEQFIKTKLPVAAVPSVPEIRLHTAGPKSGLWQLAEMDDEFGTPYWAYPWGGGLALSRYILDHPASVDGRRVLDLGAGSGLVAIAAAKAGATEVIAADIDRYALTAIRLNAQANATRVAPMLGDLTETPPPAVDLVVIGDLFYAQDLAERVLRFADRCLRSNIAVLVGDPGRVFLPRSRLQFLAQYPGPDFGDSHRVKRMQNTAFSFNALTSDELNG